MFGNYLKIAYRNILKFKVFSFINIIGLTLGITIALFIMLWVKDEMSYDKFHSQADSIYRLVVERDANGVNSSWPNNPGNLAPALEQTYPEILSTCRVFKQESKKYSVKYYNKIFNEMEVAIVDPSFLEIFDFPLISGDKRNVLANNLSPNRWW